MNSDDLIYYLSYRVDTRVDGMRLFCKLSLGLDKHSKLNWLTMLIHSNHYARLAPMPIEGTEGAECRVRLSV